MKRNMVLLLVGALAGAISLAAVTKTAVAAESKITILYDAFGNDAAMKKDWGFAALVEAGGKRILFDTGNNPSSFAQNVKAAGVDLKQLDFVIVSHRHLDHTAGLNHLLSVNPTVRIYAPKESFGVFGSVLPNEFYRKQDSLPRDMRYYDGQPADTLEFGTAWPGARFVLVDSAVEVAPGVHIISLISEATGTKELRELSLVLESPQGVVVVAGCSHPGIEAIVQAATGIDKHVHMLFGGFHLPAATDEAIARIATALHDTYKVDRVAPGHCTGEPAFYQFKKTWKEGYVYAGVGSVIDLP